MAKRIVINPVTRISGFMEIDVMVENGTVVDAKTKGNFFRGFEQMMVGRNPFDAIYLTQRICGICSTAHSTASSVALEHALNVQVTELGRYWRDIIHGCEFLQNHLRHFYQYTIPDFVKLPEVSSIYQSDHQDYRLPREVNDRIARNYFLSLEYSRLAHQMLAVLGGKAPHNHGIFVGGISTPPTTDKIIAMMSILNKISVFIKDNAIPDVYDIARYYQDYYKLGRGPGNFLSYGAFYGYATLGTLYVEPSVYAEGTFAPFQSDLITEDIGCSWYEGKTQYKPLEIMAEPDQEKKSAYSWVKAPRYNKLPFEVGPLARLWLSGEYRKGISAMDRTIARVLEADKIAGIIGVLLRQVVPDVPVQKEWKLPEAAIGIGLVDTTRGALGHWLKIDNKVLSFYQIITPSAWDFSSRDSQNIPGTAEQALIGTPIANPDQPVELGRILRSFDPCMSCATHVYLPGKEPKTIQVFG
ncbi:nickel-dependent hydrogenase large subunit [Brevibacillus thermoruber]|uniref:Nickel-dependent hydrogenase large subunit n=1 Tax=Brevibacillus thermoruber TaxID=33942 RepID=A0A9X3TMF7_9BACL|nr:nickel-dependent hydrogenase large subunit [Brevibacillus thermoruber]MDA5107085.1 nickel-dependent hydrogenase large subunit [Brevibacillus thermoruber]